MRIGFKDHRGCGLPLAAALERAGHQVASTGDLLLVDFDAPIPPYAELLAVHRRAFLYQHGLRPYVSAYPTHPNVRGRFVTAPGHAEVLAAAGWPLPVAVIGWPYFEQRPFRATQPRRVLFAPQHAIADGWIHPSFARLNAQVEELLGKLPIEVRIRRGGGLSYADIDAADVVVAAAGTVAVLAIARGKPTVMFGQDVRPDDWNPHERAVLPATTWSAWRELARYPHELDRRDPMSSLALACAVEAVDWRARFVGEPMDQADFLDRFRRAVADW